MKVKLEYDSGEWVRQYEDECPTCGGKETTLLFWGAPNPTDENEEPAVDLGLLWCSCGVVWRIDSNNKGTTRTLITDFGMSADEFFKTTILE